MANVISSQLDSFHFLYESLRATAKPKREQYLACTFFLLFAGHQRRLIKGSTYWMRVINYYSTGYNLVIKAITLTHFYSAMVKAIARHECRGIREFKTIRRRKPPTRERTLVSVVKDFFGFWLLEDSGSLFGIVKHCLFRNSGSHYPHEQLCIGDDQTNISRL